MIYENYNFTDSFSNASGSGREKMVISELAKVVREHPKAVSDTLESSNVNVPRNITKKGLGKLIRKNKSNRGMIRKLSLLIVTNAKIKENENNFSEFFGKNRKNKTATTTSGGDKQGLFKKIGNYFKQRKANKEAQGGTKEKGGFGSKIGSFFNKNQDTIASVGGSLMDSLMTNQGGSSLSTQIQGGAYPTQPPSTTPNEKKGMPMGTKIAIGLGALVGLGLVIYFVRRGKGKGK